VLLVGMLFAIAARKLSLGRLVMPGPGLWPFVLGSILVILTVCLLFAEKTDDGVEKMTVNSRYVGYGAISLFGFVALFDYVGFLLPATLLMLLWLRFLGKESWRATIIGAVAVVAGFYVLFERLLRIPFPEDAIIRLIQEVANGLL